MSPLEPEPDEREENAFFDSVWPDAWKFSRKKYKDFNPDAAEGAALDAVSVVMMKVRKSHEDLSQAQRVGRVIRKIKDELPRALKRASRQNLEQPLPDEEGAASETDDPLANVASNVRTDGPVISRQGFRVRDLAIAFMEQQHVREAMELAKDREMKVEHIAKQLGRKTDAVYEHLRIGFAELEHVMNLYVNGEELPAKIEAQLKKDRESK